MHRVARAPQFRPAPTRQIEQGQSLGSPGYTFESELPEEVILRD
jgi:hypothetical protein